MSREPVSLALTALLIILLPVATLASAAATTPGHSPSGTHQVDDFEGYFAFGNWILLQSPPTVGGSVSSNPGPPVQVFLEGGDNNVGGSVDFQITIPAAGEIQFDWGFESGDFECFDSGGYAVNGNFVELACNSSTVDFFNGSSSVSVQAGDVFSFRVFTVDGDFGPGTLGVTNFRFGEPLSPQIGLDPKVLSSLQWPNTQATLPVAISNLGDVPLQWQLSDGAAPATSRPVALDTGYVARPRLPVERPVVRDAADCARFATHAGAEPRDYALHCMPRSAPAPSRAGNRPDGVADGLAYALDLGLISEDFLVHVVDDLPGHTVLGQNSRDLFGMDFDETATTLYAIDDGSRELGTMDLDNGTFVPHASLAGVAAGQQVTGLTIDPFTGQAYLSTVAFTTGMTLYTLDLATGAATVIGVDPDRILMIDIAIGPQGVMYGHDIETDAIYTIDTATGLATLVGPTGINANFAQSMDFDNRDGTLYAYVYQGGGEQSYGTIDLATGALTPLAVNDPQGEFVGATRTIDVAVACSLPSDIPWLSASPPSGTLDPGDSETISVVLDSTGLEAGEYKASLCFSGALPGTDVVRLPVRLTVGGCLFSDRFEAGDDGSCY